MEKSGPKTSAMDLRGRQSVRATFKLSEDCINAIRTLSAQLGIKQKSVFDEIDNFIDRGKMIEKFQFE